MAGAVVEPGSDDCRAFRWRQELEPGKTSDFAFYDGVWEVKDYEESPEYGAKKQSKHEYVRENNEYEVKYCIHGDTFFD